VKTNAILLCLMLGLALAAGPASAPSMTAAVNDVNPAAIARKPLGAFSTFMDPPETAWTRPLTTTFSVGVTPVQDTLMWVSCGQSEESIYVYKLNDPSRPLVDAFPQTGGPTGWGIRDMAWKASSNEVFAGFDNQTYHVYDATTHVPNNTYIVSGYLGAVRGMGYSALEDSCWTCDFNTSPMTKFSITGANGHQVRAASEMGASYGIAVDAGQHCFWVTQTGSPGASPIWKMDFGYNVTDSFNPSGWDAGGGCEMWKDTFLLALDQATTDAVWCFKFALSPPLSHDVGVRAVIAPASHVGPDAVTPKAMVRNSGMSPEMSIPVTCWIDSGATRVYSANATFPGPLPPRGEASVSFVPDWNPGPAGASYNVTMFTSLTTDEDPSNDTATGRTKVTGAVFSDTIRVHRLAAFAPTIDGYIEPGEWSASVMYDISDLAGRGGSPQPAGSNIAYYLGDFSEGLVYFAMDCPNRSTRVDWDQFGPFMDEDRNDKWSSDSSEGNHWVEYVASGDEVLYRALLDTVPNTWEMGQTPGAVSASSLTSGHLQFEAKIPIGAGKWEYSINPGDTVGYFQYTAFDNNALYVGWWPQTLTASRWSYPRYYGTMIFEPETTGVAGPTPKMPYALYRASPSLVRDHARISYYVGRQANVELGVYDATGSRVRTLASGVVEAGERVADWDRTDDLGKRVANGTYFYRLAVDGEAISGKAVVLK